MQWSILNPPEDKTTIEVWLIRQDVAENVILSPPSPHPTFTLSANPVASI